jgi:hypothetical protein
MALTKNDDDPGNFGELWEVMGGSLTSLGELPQLNQIRQLSAHAQQTKHHEKYEECAGASWDVVDAWHGVQYVAGQPEGSEANHGAEAIEQGIIAGPYDRHF